MGGPFHVIYRRQERDDTCEDSRVLTPKAHTNSKQEQKKKRKQERTKKRRAICLPHPTHLRDNK
jgi:hypothetical protein